MNGKLITVFILTAVFALLSACSGGGDSALKKSPKDSILYQYDLLKKGDTDKLKECFTERVKSQVTSEAVEKAKENAVKNNLESLLGEMTEGTEDGKKTVFIRLNNGRALTMLIQQEDGRWLSNSIWFH